MALDWTMLPDAVHVSPAARKILAGLLGEMVVCDAPPLPTMAALLVSQLLWAEAERRWGEQLTTRIANR